MVSGPWCAPFFKDPLETTLGEIWLSQILRHIGQAETGQRGVEGLEDIIEDKLPFDSDPQFAATFFEFPRVNPAIGRKPQIDAAVVDQVSWRFWLWSLGEVRLRPDHCKAYVRPDAYCDHIFRHLPAPTDARVVTLCGDVGQSVVRDNLDSDVGIVRQKLRDFGPENGMYCVVARGDSDSAGRFLPKL